MRFFPCRSKRLTKNVEPYLENFSSLHSGTSIPLSLAICITVYSHAETLEWSSCPGNLAIHKDPSGAAMVALGRAPPQRRTRCDQHIQPFFMFARFPVIVKSAAGFLQFTKPRPGRCRQIAVIVQKTAILFGFEPQSAHPGLIVDHEQEIGLLQNSWLFPGFSRTQSLAPQDQFASPAVRRGIHENAEVAFRSELRSRIKLQVGIEDLIRMFSQPFSIELERK